MGLALAGPCRVVLARLRKWDGDSRGTVGLSRADRCVDGLALVADGATVGGAVRYNLEQVEKRLACLV